MLARLQVMAYRRLPRLGNAAVRLMSPRYTAGVLVVLVRADGRALLVQNSYRNAWFLPGGRLLSHEPVADGARREVAEELGLHLTAQALTICGASQNPRRHWVTWVARADISDAEAQLVRPHPPEVRELAWFAPASLPRLSPGLEEHLLLAGLFTCPGAPHPGVL